MSKKYLDNAGLSHLWGKIKALLSNKSDNDHAHTLEEVSDTSSYVRMTTAEREKLTDVEAGATKTVVDTALDISSDNAIANKAVYNAVAAKAEWNHTHIDATTSASGFMSTTDKTYVDSISDTIAKGEGDNSITIGKTPTASGIGSLAVGPKYAQATGNYSFAQGHATASGAFSSCQSYMGQAAGLYSHAQGWQVAAHGKASFSSGFATNARGEFSQVLGAHLYSYDYAQTAVGRYNTLETENVSQGVWDSLNGSAFVVGTGHRFTEDATSTEFRNNGFRVSYTGKCYGSSSFVASGADYAEYYEWQDGNLDNEDRRGRFVTMDGNKIKLANAEDDYILGVISAVPVVVGNAHSEVWQGMYLTDVFGERLTEAEEVPETTDKDTGEVIPAHTITRFIVNPEYDPTQPYKGRDRRKEWSAVGTHGQLVVIDDGTCEINHYCKVAENGTVTKAEGKTEYRVIERLDETHIKIVLK